MKHLGTKTIETKRLILRRFRIEDAEAMYRNWASDDEVTKYLTWSTHESEAVTKAVLKDWIENYEKSDSYYTWCIESKEIGEPIGSISVVSDNPKVGSVEIGYCISEAYWHQGITSEALAAVIKFFHEEVGIRRIESRHDPKNPYSGKVMEKCGLQYEGTRKQADWNNSGICDAALYGIVYEDAVAKEEEEEVYVAPKAVKKPGEKNVISDETIEYVGILAKLELSDEEKEQAKKDMGEMLDYIDKLNELDTTGVEPMSHVFPVNNVFREDVVTNGDGSEATLRNAPSKKDNGFKVPRTIA